MKALSLLAMLLVAAVAAQPQVTEKPCISFVPESTSETNTYAIEPLQSAVMTSGDFEFLVGVHDGCWAVHVISLPVTSTKGQRLGYAISHTVTDPKGLQVGHGLTFGPSSDIFVQAMRKAAADAIRNIRLERSTSQSFAPRGIESDRVYVGQVTIGIILTLAPSFCLSLQLQQRL